MLRTYLALFYTHTGAVKFSRLCAEKGMQAEMMPVPRKLSSSCGVSVKFSTADDVRPMMADDTESIYEVIGRDYSLICQNTIR